MTSRVGRVPSPVSSSYFRGPPVVPTPSMADRAAEQVLRDYDPGVAESIRGIWARDADNDVAVMLRQGAAALSDRARFPKHARIQTNVPYALSDAETRHLVDIFPELNMTFHTSALHDHGLGAAVRHNDQLVNRSTIPPGMRYVDFGGDELKYVQEGEINARVVRTTLDSKDAVRGAHRRMRLEMIARETANAPTGSKEANQHMMATSVLRGDGQFLVNQTLQEFNQPALVGMMSHVYDVPVADIPFMMERCGMKLLVITLHFSTRFFDTDAGEIPGLGARYRINRDEDEFEFGFSGSGARWYRHKWSEFQRYGADQILQGNERRYSMKIVKRRGDTLTFNVLEIGGHAVTNQNQWYRVPDVPCVRVTADLGRKSHGLGSRIDEVFPEDVWNRMVREAAADLTRGICDYSKAVGNFSQITAGHTYNGKDAVLGTVPVEKVPLLVVLSSVSAAASVARMRAGIKYGIDVELDHRAVREMDVGKLVFSVFFAGLQAAVSAPLFPFMKALEGLTRYGGEALLKRLVEVEPVQQVRRIPADVYQDVLYSGGALPRDDFPSRDFLWETRDLQNFLDQMVDESRGTAELGAVSHTVDGGDAPPDGKAGQAGVGADDSAGGEGSTTLADTDSTEPPEWFPREDSDMKFERCDTYHRHTDRRNAMLEEIEAIKQEAHNSEAWLASKWLEVLATGSPDVGLMRRKYEEWGGLSAWYVTEGVLSYCADKSQAIADFKYGAVYCPDVMVVPLLGDGGTMISKLRPVEEHTWSNPDQSLQRIHKVLAGAPYTGWVLVNKSTVVYNGPLVINGILRALPLPASYEVGVYVGGPGAGKTYLMGKRWTNQCITSPLVNSIGDARDMLVTKHGLKLLKTQQVAKTIDAWLCMAGRGKSVPLSTEVLSDEVYNGHPGRAYAVWSLMRARRVVAYGDMRQIEPIDPAAVVRVYKTLMPQYIMWTYKIYRFGPEIVAMINGHYEHKLRSVHPVGYSRVVWLDDLTKYVPRHEDHKILGAWQVHKTYARKLYPDQVDHIATIHETQGATTDEALVANFDTRKRPKNDPFDLLQNPRYVAVGCSRPRKLLVLGNRGSWNLLREWYEHSQDPRRVAAAADIATAGQSIERL